MCIYQSWSFLYYLFSALFSHAKTIQTAKLITLFTFSKQPNICYCLNSCVLIKKGRFVYVSRTTMYKHRSISISFTKKILNGSRNSIFPKVQKLWNRKFNIQKQCKVNLTSLQMTQAKELEEPNNNYPFPHSYWWSHNFSYFSTTKSYFIYFIFLLYKTFNISSFILAFNTIK